ncbi:MAG TPA: hypothetical protein VF503_27730 [Sphingobium sp.]|uniref:virion core protein, T7 gp14 family n=1 Tax=Sphingobium sp. TaxID=1912891 RepID=UPI002ED3D39B
MCDPIVGLVLTVATTAASAIGQMQAAKTQAKAITAQQQVMVEENRKAASTEIFDRMRSARREQGRIRTAAGEAGLSLGSGSVENLLLDSAMQSELSNQRSLANMESRIAAGDAEANSMRSQVQSPTLLGAGLQIASAVTSDAIKIAKGAAETKRFNAALAKSTSPKRQEGAPVITSA